MQKEKKKKVTYATAFCLLFQEYPVPQVEWSIRCDPNEGFANDEIYRQEERRRKSGCVHTCESERLNERESVCVVKAIDTELEYMRQRKCVLQSFIRSNSSREEGGGVYIYICTERKRESTKVGTREEGGGR
jgi:hypothetical protein